VEVNAKVKELEDEVKVLKAEIRNVLLDIREAILDNTNPLAEHQEPTYLRMDLNTTARSIAAEEAARVAREALEQARGTEDTQDKAQEPETPVAADLPPEEETPEEEGAAAEAMSEEPMESEPEELEIDGDGGLPANGEASRKNKAPKEATLEPTAIPSMYLTSLLPTGATSGLAAWVTEAMAVIGPQDLERVITIHRLWGSLPPNISYALAHLQRLIRSSRDAEPAWLKVMQDMEKLASS
jgi:chemotaxis protein histidine kinase CheA